MTVWTQLHIFQSSPEFWILECFECDLFAHIPDKCDSQQRADCQNTSQEFVVEWIQALCFSINYTVNDDDDDDEIFLTITMFNTIVAQSWNHGRHVRTFTKPKEKLRPPFVLFKSSGTIIIDNNDDDYVWVNTWEKYELWKESNNGSNRDHMRKRWYHLLLLEFQDQHNIQRKRWSLGN